MTVRLVEEDSLDERRLRIAEIEANALEHAERLALRILDNPAWVHDIHAAKLAVVVAEQTKLAHSLRNALHIEVAG